MAKTANLPVPFNAEHFDRLWQMVEQLQLAHAALAGRLAADKERLEEHPVIGSPLHLRILDAGGHPSCVPAVCVSAGTDEERDTLTLIAFTRGGEGLPGAPPALRRTDVRRGVGEHLSWHWPDDVAAHAWKPPKAIED